MSNKMPSGLILDGNSGLSGGNSGEAGRSAQSNTKAEDESREDGSVKRESPTRKISRFQVSVVKEGTYAKSAVSISSYLLYLNR